jgi:hypothetical protein
MVKTYSTEHLMKLLRKRVNARGLREAARELGFSAPYLHDVLNGRRLMGEGLGDSLGFDLVPPAAPPARRWVSRASVSTRLAGGEK